MPFLEQAKDGGVFKELVGFHFMFPRIAALGDFVLLIPVSKVFVVRIVVLLFLDQSLEVQAKGEEGKEVAVGFCSDNRWGEDFLLPPLPGLRCG